MRQGTGIGGILRQGASVAGTRLLLIVASFVSSIVVARGLPVAERGLFGLLMAVAALGVQLGNFGLPVANTYLVARDRSLLRAVAANSSWFFLIMIGVLAVLGAATIRLVPGWRPLWGVAAAMVWLVAVTGLLQLLVQNILVGKFQFGVSNSVDLVARLGGIAAMALLWLAGLVTAGWFAAGAGLFSLVASAWGLRRGEIEASLVGRDAKLGREQLRLGSRAYAACLVSFVVSRLPLYAIGSRGTLQEVAFFTQALVIADTMLVVPSAIGTVLLPSLAASADAEHRVRSTLRLGGVALLLMLVGSAATWWIGPWILPAVYGPTYAASMPFLITMLPGVVAIGICSVTQNALCANGYPWSSVASPLAGVVAVLAALAWSGGTAACALAYSAGGIVMAFVSAAAWWLDRQSLSAQPVQPDLPARSEP